MIKTYEKQAVRNSLVDEMVRQEIERLNAERDAEEAERQKAIEAEIKRLEDELALCKKRETRIFTQFIEDDKEVYPPTKEPTVLAKVWWAIVGWTVLGFDKLYRAVVS